MTQHSATKCRAVNAHRKPCGHRGLLDGLCEYHHPEHNQTPESRRALVARMVIPRERTGCQAKNLDGSPCCRKVRLNGWCYEHDPATPSFEERQARRAASEARHQAELAAHQAELAAWKAKAAEQRAAMRKRDWMRKRRRLMAKAERLLVRENADALAVARANALLELVRALEVADPYADEAPAYPEISE